MEAKKKAKELFDKYCFAIRTEQTDSGYFTNVIYAKDCALIAVDEIINANPVEFEHALMFVKSKITSDEWYMIDNKEYWKEVRNEINKL